LPSYLFTAVHKGPYLSIQALESSLGTEAVLYLVEGIAKEERKRNGLVYLDLEQIETRWGNLEAFLQNSRIKAIIRSSSEQVLERNLENMASRAARKLRLPVFVVEDFPGNYWARPGERLDGLFVEDDWVVELHKTRGISARLLSSTGNPRYDSLATIDRHKRRIETRKALNIGDAPAMLWVGQPDGENSYLTLRRLLSLVGNLQFILLFRAHPRDESYKTSRYKNLFGKSNLRILDVSFYHDVIDLYCASELVASEFSSACVEASHLGVPALFVLFEDLGKRYLQTFKGYEIPLWCRENCTFLVEREVGAIDVVKQALFDNTSRIQVCSRFSKRYKKNTNIARLIARRIRQIVEPKREEGKDAYV